MQIRKQIGRYTIPLDGIVATKQRTGFWAWIWPGYDVILVGGVRLRMTEEEKQLLEQAQEEHTLVLQVYGMCRGLGLRG